MVYTLSETMCTSTSSVTYKLYLDQSKRMAYDERACPFRTCLHGSGGPQVGEVTRLGGVKKKPPLHVILQPRHHGCTFSRLLNGRYARKQENAGKPRVFAINVLLHSRAALAATFSAVAFYCYL